MLDSGVILDLPSQTLTPASGWKGSVSRPRDGRSPGLRVIARTGLPGGRLSGPSVTYSVALSAHSCGGSYGFGP